MTLIESRREFILYLKSDLDPNKSSNFHFVLTEVYIFHIIICDKLQCCVLHVTWLIHVSGYVTDNLIYYSYVMGGGAGNEQLTLTSLARASRRLPK